MLVVLDDALSGVVVVVHEAFTWFQQQMNTNEVNLTINQNILPLGKLCFLPRTETKAMAPRDAVTTS